MRPDPKRPVQLALIGGALVLAGAGIGLALTRTVNTPIPPPADASSAAPHASSSVQPPALASTTTMDRARAGDLIALKQLERRPASERPIDETVVLAEGHAALKRADLAALVQDVGTAPTLLDDANTVRLLHGYAHDPEVARQALEGLARLDHPIAPDVLFDVWQHSEHSASSELADALLHHASVRARATPPLALALSLMDTDRCSKLAKLLPEAKVQGDRRSLEGLKRLERRDGCGPKRNEDCFACLRTPENEAALRQALEAARKREAPAPWRSRRVQPESVFDAYVPGKSVQQRKPVE